MVNAEQTVYNITLEDDTEIHADRYSAHGNYLILWLAPEYGFKPSHKTLAEDLALQGIEIWQVNLLESLFLTQSLSSLKSIRPEMVAELMEQLYAITQKNLILMGDSYAALNVLQGIHHWQSLSSDARIIGSILLSPNTYVKIPPLGQKPQYHPVVSATNTPVMMFQAEQNSNTNQFDTLKERLSIHSNAVYSKLMPGVHALFYADPPTSAIDKHLQQLPHDIRKIIPLLAHHAVPEHPITLNNTVTFDESGLDSQLKPYKGKVKPSAIETHDVFGNNYSKTDFQGQITIVNFWATWCPPCVHEIPSLNRFKALMADWPVELISINYKEDTGSIKAFMKNVQVDFPVLLDESGQLAKQWQVITFPSTFVIDQQGEIRYGVNASIEWDEAEIFNTIQSLLKHY